MLLFIKFLICFEKTKGVSPSETESTEGKMCFLSSSCFVDSSLCLQCLVTEGAGSYYHLNHSELVALLVQREADLERQKAEFERQKLLLAKREVELRKLKPQVRDLEDYIDTLLVRIMEQKPTLLQVRTKLK